MNRAQRIAVGRMRRGWIHGLKACPVSENTVLYSAELALWIVAAPFGGTLPELVNPLTDRPFLDPLRPAS